MAGAGLVASFRSSYSESETTRMSNTLHYTCWLITLLLQMAAAVIMLRRRTYREFRAFFLYQAFHAIRAIVLFGILRWHLSHRTAYALYFWSYWLADVISTTIILFVIYGVFQKVLRDYASLHRFVSLAFSAAVIVLLVVAIGVTALAPGNEGNSVISAILLFERSLMVLQIGLVFLLAAFARFAAIPWRGELSFGIALGYGVVSAISLAALTMRAEVGSVGNEIYNIMTVSGYTVAVLIWFLYILAPVRKTELMEAPPSQSDVREWNEALTELLSR
jgi:hypothetical protein